MSEFWQDRPTLVTGATGLVGGWLVKHLLSKGADVVCLIRDWVPQSELIRTGLVERLTSVRGDICDRRLVGCALADYEIATVFHLAAQTIVGVANRDPVPTLQTNVAGTWSLLEACRQSPLVKQAVIASSDKAYGNQSTLPYDEAMPLQGRHPYDVSKSCADLITQMYSQSYGVPAAITRCGNIYGGGDLNWNRVVPGTVRSVLRSQRPVIRSDGKFVRDYFYVEDAAIGYMRLAEQMELNPTLRGQAFNFSAEEPLSVLGIVDAILEKMGSDLLPDVRNEASNEIRDQHLSSRKAREVLGWKPVFGLDEGLERSIRWYRDFLEN